MHNSPVLLSFLVFKITNTSNQSAVLSPEAHYTCFGELIFGRPRRTAVIAFRITMIHTTFRLARAESIPGVMRWSDEDLATTLSLAFTLANHDGKAFADFPKWWKLQNLKCHYQVS